MTSKPSKNDKRIDKKIYENDAVVVFNIVVSYKKAWIG